MLAKVIIENGTKKIQALTADTGTGAPVGSYLYLEKKSNPQGYLFCDGSTFDETAYPALYQYLGTNVLPDWRELGAKGAEKNTTLIFDSTETDPSTGQAGAQNHDVFAQGEFKDDQLQNHTHFIGGDRDNQITQTGTDGQQSSTLKMGNASGIFQNLYALTLKDGRHGTVTRGKSRAVFIYIKATSGLTENQQENVLNTINENNSYSTEEHPTGKKWIDGKPIYSKVIDCGALPNATAKQISHNITNLSKIINVSAMADTGTIFVSLPFVSKSNLSQQIAISVNATQVIIETAIDYTGFTNAFVILEYTKTTD